MFRCLLTTILMLGIFTSCAYSSLHIGMMLSGIMRQMARVDILRANMLQCGECGMESWTARGAKWIAGGIVIGAPEIQP